MRSVQRLPDSGFLALFDIGTVAEALGENDVTAAKTALVEHYGRRVRDNWPGFPARVADYKIDLDKADREAVLEQADMLLQHRFLLSGLPPVAMGDDIDWSSSPTSDPAWGFALNRHRWMPVLVRAYQWTGDDRYVRELIALLVDWIDKNPPPKRKNEQSPAWRLMEVGMRLYLTWIPIFGVIYDEPEFGPDLKLRMLRAIYDHARFLTLFWTNRNHLVRESLGLAYAGFCFPEFADAGEWRQTALGRLNGELLEQINEDGSQIEMSTGYQWLTIDEYQYLYDLLALMHDPARHEIAGWLEKMYDVLVRVVRPDHSFPLIHDGTLADNEILLEKLTSAGEALGRDDLLFVGTRGRRGGAPAEVSARVRDAGWHVMRSDWHEDARYLFFNAGPFGGPHGHEDKLNIEVCAYGQPFLVDPGNFTYDAGHRFRPYFVSSAAHNVVLVDGGSQIRGWTETNRHPKTARGDYALWVSRPELDYACAAYDEGFAGYRLRQPPDADLVDDVVHTRHVVFVKPDYWLVVDRLDAREPHDYDLLFQAWPDLSAQPGAGDRVTLRAGPDGPRLHLIPVPHADRTLRIVEGSEEPVQGWYSPGYNQAVPAATIVYTHRRSGPTTLATLLYPVSKDDMQGDEDVSVEAVPLDEGDGLAYAVTTSAGKDWIMLSANRETKRFGAHRSAARLAAIRTDAAGNENGRFEWIAR